MKWTGIIKFYNSDIYSISLEIEYDWRGWNIFLLFLPGKIWDQYVFTIFTFQKAWHGQTFKKGFCRWSKRAFNVILHNFEHQFIHNNH